jgi:hypothetical protein
MRVSPNFRRIVAAWCAAALLGSCRSATDATTLVVLSSTLSSPAPLVRTLDVMLERPAELTVDYWTDGAKRLRVHSAATAHHALLLTRLRAGRTYHYEAPGTTVSGTFVADALPADLATAVVSATGTRTAPLVMLHLFEPTGFKGYAVVDEASEVVWYWRTTDFPFGMTRRADGSFVLMDKGRGLVHVSADGRVLHELAQDLVQRELHHDAIASPANTILFIAFDDRTIDGARVRGDAIWEWTPESGAVVKRWSVWDHFTFATAPAPRGSGEWVHANALAIGPRGNILLSAHHWNQILSITPGWQQIEWRLGGANATHPLPAAEAFSGQHTAREISTGRIVLFDNGTSRGGYSRAVEFMQDGSTARTLWEWRSTPANYASAVGSARRLANGNTLVAFGMAAGLAGSTGPTEVYELNATGATVWHLVVRTQTMYRAEPLDDVAGEEVVR